jgi:hypothetical protein
VVAPEEAGSQASRIPQKLPLKAFFPGSFISEKVSPVFHKTHYGPLVKNDASILSVHFLDAEANKAGCFVYLHFEGL